MSYKSDIRKAITNNTRYVAIKVYKPEYSEYLSGRDIIMIEVEVRKKTRKEIHINSDKKMAQIADYKAEKAISDESFRYHATQARSTLFPGKSLKEVKKIIEEIIDKSK